MSDLNEFLNEYNYELLHIGTDNYKLVQNDNVIADIDNVGEEYDCWRATMRKSEDYFYADTLLELIEEINLNTGYTDIDGFDLDI